MIGTNYRPLEQRPCVLNAVRVNIPAHVLFSPMVHRFVLCVVIFNAEVSRVLVCDNAFRIGFGSLSDELSDDLLAWILAALLSLHSDRSATLNRADHHRLVSEIGAESPVLLAANPSLIHFDRTFELRRINFLHGLADAMAELPRC